MFDILIFSDLHVHAHKQSPKRLDDGIECLKWVIETARNHNIKEVLFLGDLFQDRQRVHVLAYNRVYELLKTADINFTILIGNHDMWFYDKRDVSSIIPFGALSNVTIIGESTTLAINNLPIDFAPYSVNPASVLSNFKTKSPILCGHFAVTGALLNFVYKTYSEVEVESDSDMVPVTAALFKGWEKVFLGHYHGAQTIDNIEYVGSPMELTWNESTQQKHVILFDSKTFEKKYIINTFSPRHLSLKYEELANYDLANSFLKVQINDDNDLLKIKYELSDKKLRELDFSNKKKLDQTITEDRQEKFDLIEGDVLERFVKSIGCGDLEEDLILEIGRGICTSEV